MQTSPSIFRLALVLGGARSGKSRYALSLAEGFPLPRLFVATCEPRDEEMRARIDNHQQHPCAQRGSVHLAYPGSDDLPYQPPG